MTTVAGGRSAQKYEAPASHPFSCNTCQVAFRNSDLQKSHMKGDWHRYNLQRRVTSFPPISSELFAERVLQARATSAAKADRAVIEHVCTVCQKSFSSDNSFRNHLSSQKHRAREALASARGPRPKDGDEVSSVLSSTFSLGEPHQRGAAAPSHGGNTLDAAAEAEFSEVVEGLKKTAIAEEEEASSPVKRPANPHPSDAPAGPDGASTTAPKSNEPPHSLTSCLFCNYVSPTIALNTSHMERFHGMFLPEKQYLIDIEGLLGQLQTRIRDDHECIFCATIRADVYAVQTHMRDKAHCKIPFSTEAEQIDIGDFYDFRATYSDSEPEDDESDDEEDGRKAGGGVKLGAKRATRTVVARDSDADEDADGDERGEANGEGWETDSSASSLDSADLTAVPADHHYHQYDRLGKHPHHSQTDPRAHHQKDGWHSHAHKHGHAVFYDEYELHLPSGRSVGHRSLNRYYRQNLRNYPSAAEREELAQLALEAGDAGEGDSDHAETREGGADTALTRTPAGSRAVSHRPPPRNVAGLAGVSDRAKADIVKAERKAFLSQKRSHDKARLHFTANSIGKNFQFLGRT